MAACTLRGYAAWWPPQILHPFDGLLAPITAHFFFNSLVRIALLATRTTLQLTTAASLAKFLCPTKAIVRTFETAHNYADNTDTYTKANSWRTPPLALSVFALERLGRKSPINLGRLATQEMDSP